MVFVGTKKTAGSLRQTVHIVKHLFKLISITGNRLLCKKKKYSIRALMGFGPVRLINGQTKADRKIRKKGRGWFDLEAAKSL